MAVNCKINGKPVTVESGTTVLEAARGAGFEVPHFCWHPGLSRPANCRMCLVDASNSPKPIPSCYITVAENADYTTDSDHVRELRRAILEFILLNHPIDCAICDQAGECELQNNYFDYSLQESRLATDKVHKPKVTPLSDKIMFDGERCIVCTRCVRFCDEVAKSSEIGVINRGERSEIAIFPGRALSNPYSMNIVDICPVGALTSRDFRFKCRVWFMESVDSVCDGCARGCNVHLDHHKGEVMRFRPRENRSVNDWWMCDTGRLSYRGIHDERVLAPVVSSAGRTGRATWADGVSAAIELLREGASGLGIVLGATLDLESLFAARRLVREVLPQARVFMSAREDGRDQDDILLRDDKNPNRAGVAALFGELPGIAALRNAAHAGTVTHVLVIGHPPEAMDLGSSKLVMATTHVTEAVRAAAVVLPLQTHAEHDGTFINFEQHVQRFHGAVAPIGEALSGWQIIGKLSVGLGHDLRLTSAAAVFKALVAAEPAFAGMTHHSLGGSGCRLGSGIAADGASLVQSGPLVDPAPVPA